MQALADMSDSHDPFHPSHDLSLKATHFSQRNPGWPFQTRPSQTLYLALAVVAHFFAPCCMAWFVKPQVREVRLEGFLLLEVLLGCLSMSSFSPLGAETASSEPSSFQLPRQVVLTLVALQKAVAAICSREVGG